MFYSLGWVYRENNPSPIIWHDGEVTGMKSTIAFAPNAKLGIVILSNSSTDIPEILVMRFFDLYFGKKLQDYSGEMLIEAQKIDSQNKDNPPKNPSLPLPLDKYTGNYSNKIYGLLNISLVDGRLVVAMGNKGIFKMTLVHWHRDIFTLYGSATSRDEKNGYIQFEVDAFGNIGSFTIEPLNEKFQKI